MDPTHHCVVVGDAERLEGALEAFDAEAVSVAEAAAVVAATTPACVVIAGSADGDGLEAVEAVRGVSATIPVLYASPEPCGRVAAAATRAGADEYAVIDRPGDGTGSAEETSLAARIDALVDATESVVPGSPSVDEDQLAALLATMDGVGPGEHANVVVDVELSDGERVPAGGRITRLSPDVDTARRDVEGEDVESDAFLCVVGDVVDRERHEASIKRLLSTTRALFACDTTDEIADTVTTAAANVFEFDYVAVRLYDEETDELVLTSGTDDVYEYFGDRERVHVDESQMGETFLRGEPRLFEDMRGESPYDYGPLRGAMGIPIGRYGMLTVCSPVVDAFSVADVKLAQLLTANAEAALDGVTRRETLTRYEHVLEAVEGMVYALDDEGHFTLVTGPFADRVGYDREELVGEHASILLDRADVDRAVSCIRSLISDPDRTSITYEAAVQTAIGGEFPVEIEISLLPSEDSFRGTVGAVRDITERKERERYLQVLNRILRHNLRNDLTIVMGYADILTRGIEDDNLAHTAETVHEISTDLAELSEDAKRIERTLRRGRIEGHPVDLAVIVDRVVANGDWESRGAAIETDVPDRLRARADDELATALDHLVENAVEHNPDPDPTVRIGAGRTDRAIVLTVEDDGPGIPRAEREIITGERDITQLSHGSGLGLWLVRWIVDSYGGHVTFDRSDLGGSRVEISLEATPAADST